MIHNRGVLKTISKGESEKEEPFVSCTTMMSISDGVSSSFFLQFLVENKHDHINSH